MHPGARRAAIVWDPWRSVWTVSTTERAAEGAANRAVLEQLAELLGVPAGRVRLEAGARSRRKTVVVEGRSPAEVEARLAPLRAPRGPGAF